jgi:hypothetical protein
LSGTIIARLLAGEKENRSTTRSFLAIASNCLSVSWACGAS